MCDCTKKTRQDAAGRADTLKGVPIRRLGALEYSWGTEHVKAFEAATIKALSAGVPVKVLHKGKTIGKTANARVDSDVLRVDLELDEEPPFRELSLGYELKDVRADGEQVIDVVTELAFVPRGRCGETCSIDNARADAARDLQGGKDRAMLEITIGPRPLFEVLKP